MDGDAVRAVTGGALIGFGVAGILDVAVFHLLLQWHHFITSGDPAQELRSDGALVLALTAVTIAGVAVLWTARAAPASGASGAVAFGGGLIGAGVFNAFDVIVDHALLDLHDVVEGGTSPVPDVAWFTGSLLLLAAGILVVRRATRARAHAGARPTV